MRYLSSYTNDQTTEVFNRFGAFFAFSDEQFNKAKQAGVEYESLGAGLIAPVGSATALMGELANIHNKARQQDISDHGIKAIIHRELANHECQITMDYTDALPALEPYGITVEQIKAEWDEFYQHCVDNDYF